MLLKLSVYVTHVEAYVQMLASSEYYNYTYKSHGKICSA